MTTALVEQVCFGLTEASKTPAPQWRAQTADRPNFLFLARSNFRRRNTKLRSPNRRCNNGFLVQPVVSCNPRAGSQMHLTLSTQHQLMQPTNRLNNNNRQLLVKRVKFICLF